jgi:peroxiredoxin Q/BCP
MGTTGRPHLRLLLGAAVVLVGAIAARSPGAHAGETEPAVGEAAPAFELEDASGNEVALADFKGKSHVLVAFYPHDFSPVCTNEMKCLARGQRLLEERDVTVLAISVDSKETHTRFARALGLRFPLLSDPDLDVAKSYGVHSPSPGGGFAARSVFLVDKEGVLRHVDRDFRVPKTLEGSDLLAAVEAMTEGQSDPFAGLAELPSPEREGKTLLGRAVAAVLAEDTAAIEALLHGQFRALPGEKAEAAAERKTAFLDLCRTTFEKHDLTGKKLTDVFRMKDVLVLDRDAATGAVLKTFRSEIRTLAAGLRPGDVLVAVRGRGLYGTAGATVLHRELAIVMRKEGETWKIAELSGR